VPFFDDAVRVPIASMKTKPAPLVLPPQPEARSERYRRDEGAERRIEALTRIPAWLHT
jgi:hypothetical protein